MEFVFNGPFGRSFFTACSDDDNNGNGDGKGDVTVLKGSITSDVTLKAGNTYKLSGEHIVESGATLNIEGGVTIEAVYDDSFDWTEGWNGTATNLVAYQEPESALGYECDCLMECDNNGSNNAATPVAHPRLSNLILVGNSSAKNKHGIRLRAGTEVEINNAKVCGKVNPLAVETELTENALKNGKSVLKNMTISSELVSKQNIYTNANFVVGENNKVDAGLKYASFDAVKAECDWMKGNWVR